VDQFSNSYIFVLVQLIVEVNTVYKTSFSPLLYRALY
jgi:hypothetical protein